MKKEGRLLHERWWLDDDFSYGDATLLPKNMTARQLTQGCFSARTKFNTARSIAYRLFDRHANFRSPYRAGIYLIANLISRREIFSKQSRPLGSSANALEERVA